MTEGAGCAGIGDPVSTRLLDAQIHSRRLTPTIIVAHFTDSRGELQFGEWRSTLDPALITRAKAREIRASLEVMTERLGGELLSLQLLSNGRGRALD